MQFPSRSSFRTLFAVVRPSVCGGLLVGMALVLAQATLAQTADPQPTPTSAPDPTATPGDSPAPAPSGSPSPAAPPDFTNPAVVAAYNAARTPQVNVTVAATATPATSGTSGTLAASVAASRNAAQSVQPVIQSGLGTLVRLPSPARAKSKTSSGTSSSTNSTTGSQPVTTVVLTYAPGRAGQLVWVQMLRGGTLTADDGAGHTYDGSNGFYLQLDANAMAAFNYQAPNASGTYQVLTRFTNVTTTLPFLVPDAAP